MQTINIIGPASYQTMPWRNGLGSTVEMLKQCLPGSDEFAWRLSMADVTTDGAFSHFSGYDRTLLLLEGDGITLEFTSDQRSAALTERLHSARFNGEDETIASLHDGPIKDFNVMALRSCCCADVISHDNSSARQIDVHCDVLLVYAVEHHLTAAAEGDKLIHIPQRSLLRVDKPEKQRFVFSGTPFIAVQIRYTNSELITR